MLQQRSSHDKAAEASGRASESHRRASEMHERASVAQDAVVAVHDKRASLDSSARVSPSTSGGSTPRHAPSRSGWTSPRKLSNPCVPASPTPPSPRSAALVPPSLPLPPPPLSPPPKESRLKPPPGQVRSVAAGSGHQRQASVGLVPRQSLLGRASPSPAKRAAARPQSFSSTRPLKLPEGQVGPRAKSGNATPKPPDTTRWKR